MFVGAGTEPNWRSLAACSMIAPDVLQYPCLAPHISLAKAWNHQQLFQRKDNSYVPAELVVLQKCIPHVGALYAAAWDEFQQKPRTYNIGDNAPCVYKA
ncbi:hypothetical protein HBI56_075810 [Parastagonospora nodorum]|nr:hypothetical protein HBH52_061140 [Parastagonospora nodorum]KAH3985373.1 hypothetical protein HBH51_019970 [Parastagonospora nodorum]KAH4054203.1 hypothetical protein HBH49_077200 [Parastagonospora nodorum]KAH4106530.1 hypothetical protein HBH46_067980 [Parastagonospora nodorum]KAH4174386.1 hypothetical protein HBH43_075620 [Parastagonospora nodorum]